MPIFIFVYNKSRLPLYKKGYINQIL